jgi:predicted anti-sigma-YlaC factor YlaD
MGRDMPQSPLDRTRVSAQAWAQFRVLMKVMAWITLVVVIAALAFFYFQGEPLSVHFYIALTLGIAGAMLMTAALMGLVFLSSGTGHDEDVADVRQEEDRG